MLSNQRARRPKGETVLKPMRPNVGIEIELRRRLLALIDEMNGSILYWTKAAYRQNEPDAATLAQDETPAAEIMKAIRGLRKRWLARFDKAAKDLADYFSIAVKDRSDAALKKILKDGGFSIEWRMTPAMKDILRATVEENVSLIKSIPSQHFDKIEGMVMRSVQTGRDLQQLTDDLQKSFGVTRRRAEFIARDQNNKATAAFRRARYIEVGIEEAIWRHSGGGREPRPSHVKAGKESVRFSVAEGWEDPDAGEKIQPGQLINCRCFCRPVLKYGAPGAAS